jgi:hypothetical protein
MSKIKVPLPVGIAGPKAVPMPRSSPKPAPVMGGAGLADYPRKKPGVPARGMARSALK